MYVERAEGVLCIKWSLAPPKYAVRAHNIFTHNFLNIQLIFNLKKVLESYVCQSMSKGSKVKITFNPSTYIVLDGMVGKIRVSAFQNFFQIENRLNIKKVMSKNVMSPCSIFWRGQRSLYTEYTFDPFNMSKMTNITLYTVLCKSHKHYF